MQKTAVILGAGQFGRAAYQLLDPEVWQVLAFGDNNPASEDRTANPPVLSVQEAVSLGPDTIFIALRDYDRYRALEMQVRDLGWQGEILRFEKQVEDFSARNATLIRACERIREENIAGDMAELGVYRGDFAAQMNRLLPARNLYLFDTFEGFAEESAAIDRLGGFSSAEKGDFSDTAAEAVLARMPHPEKAILRKGLFPATAEGLFETPVPSPESAAPAVASDSAVPSTPAGPAGQSGRFCLVSLDADLYQSTLDGLRYFWPRLSPGGMIFLHDWGSRQYAGVKAAVSAYEKELAQTNHAAAGGTNVSDSKGLPGSCVHLPLVPLCDIHGTAVIVKG